MKPPTTLIVAAVTAMKPSEVATPVAGPTPAATSEPTSEMPRDGVGGRHQRRVQQGRHLGDDLKADEAGQHEHVELDEGGGVHASPFDGGCRGTARRRSAAHAQLPAWVTAMGPMISSSRSSRRPGRGASGAPRAAPEEVLQERQQVPAVDLARVEGHGGGDVDRRPAPDAVLRLDRLAGPGELAVAAASRRPGRRSPRPASWSAPSPR